MLTKVTGPTATRLQCAVCESCRLASASCCGCEGSSLPTGLPGSRRMAPGLTALRQRPSAVASRHPHSGGSRGPERMLTPAQVELASGPGRPQVPPVKSPGCPKRGLFLPSLGACLYPDGRPSPGSSGPWRPALSPRMGSLRGCRSPRRGCPAMPRARRSRSGGRPGTVRLRLEQRRREGWLRPPGPLLPSRARLPSLPPSCSQLGGPLGREAWGSGIKARSCHPEQAAHRPGRAGASGTRGGPPASAKQPWPPPTGLWRTDRRMADLPPCRAPSATWR